MRPDALARTAISATLAVLTLVQPACGVEPVATPAFVPIAQLRAWERERPWECMDYDPASDTCGAVGRVAWDDTTASRAETEFLISVEPRVSVLVASRIELFEVKSCLDVLEAEVAIVADVALDASTVERIVDRYQSSIREQGQIFCSALVQREDHFLIHSWADGVPKGPPHTLHLFADKPRLRLPDGSA